MPDNITNLHAFDDDQQILEFMLNIEVFKNAVIEEADHDQALQEEQEKCKENPMPKGKCLLKKKLICRTISVGPPTLKYKFPLWHIDT